MITRTVRGLAAVTSRTRRSADGGRASVARSRASRPPIIGLLPTTTTATSASLAAAAAPATPSDSGSQRSRNAWPVAVDSSSAAPPGASVRRNVSRTVHPSGFPAVTASVPSPVTVRYLPLCAPRSVMTSSPQSKLYQSS